MLVLETMLGRLGSRFTLHFLQTSQRGVWISPLGKFYDHLWDMTLGLEARKNGTNEVVRLALPYTKDAQWQIFPEIEQELTMTKVSFKARDRRGFAAQFDFIAPFYPQNEKLSNAPFIYLNAEVKAPPEWELKLVVGLRDPNGQAKCEISRLLPGGTLTTTYQEMYGHWGPQNPPDSLSKKTFEAPLLLACLHPPKNFELNEQDKIELRITDHDAVKSSYILASHIAEPILEVNGELHRFKYNEYCPDLAAVVKLARETREEALRKSALVDRLTEGSIGKGAADLIAFAFQSFVPNTWWTVPINGGTDWFSNWEGNCAFHSTVDVEYNLAWIYLLLWPELLEKQLTQWRNYTKTGEHGVWLSHDVGGLLGANRQVYSHEMEVEENANFILLTWALWRYTGKQAVWRDNLKTVSMLADYIINADTVGDGFPNRGIANTIDDASPAVQFGKKQVYLGVKAMCALHVAALMLDENEDNDDKTRAEEYKARVTLINQTLNSQAWLGDHYAVCLDRTTEGLVNPWTGQPLPEGELKGWDAYSLYTANGLLYLLATDAAPPTDDYYQRFRKDVKTARTHSLIEYGCTHSSADHSNIWISQNLHRDFVGAYLNVDPAGMLERYWAFEQFENATGRGGCFVDTYGANHLHYYPRGITALGLLPALAGMQVDRVRNWINYQPVRFPLNVALPALADWENEKLPFLHAEVNRGFEYYINNNPED